MDVRQHVCADITAKLALKLNRDFPFYASNFYVILAGILFQLLVEETGLSSSLYLFPGFLLVLNATSIYQKKNFMDAFAIERKEK